MGTKKRIKALEARVAALEGTAGTVKLMLQDDGDRPKLGPIVRTTQGPDGVRVEAFSCLYEPSPTEHTAYEWLTSEADPSDCYIAGDKPGFQRARAEVRKKLDGNGDTVWWWTVHGAGSGVWRCGLDVTKSKCEALLRKTVTPEQEATAEGVTLGVWREDDVGAWYRDQPSGQTDDTHGCVEPHGDMWEADVWLFDGGLNEHLGIHKSLSAAMLATDARLREAGVVLPPTALVELREGVWLVDLVGSGESVKGGWLPYGEDQIAGYLDWLADQGWDTAIARAMLREREAAESVKAAAQTRQDAGPVPAPSTGTNPGGAAFPADPPDPRKAAAEGWGWVFRQNGAGNWLASNGDLSRWGLQYLPDLLDAIEAIEVEAAEDRGWDISGPEDDIRDEWQPRWYACHIDAGEAKGPARHALITAIHEAEAREAAAEKRHHAPAYQRLVITAEYSREDEGWIAETDKTNDLSAFGTTIEECIRGMADVWSMADECDSLIFDAPEPARPLEGVVLSGVWERVYFEGRGGWFDQHLPSDGSDAIVVHSPIDNHHDSTGTFWISRHGSPVFASIGTRADAIAKARELGAEVAS